MGNVVEMPGIAMREFTEMDDGQFWLTEKILNDPNLKRRLVRTQIEELLALWRQYPLPEFEAVRQILDQMQRGYGDVEPFNHPLLAGLDDPDDEVAA